MLAVEIPSQPFRQHQGLWVLPGQLPHQPFVTISPLSPSVPRWLVPGQEMLQGTGSPCPRGRGGTAGWPLLQYSSCSCSNVSGTVSYRSSAIKNKYIRLSETNGCWRQEEQHRDRSPRWHPRACPTQHPLVPAELGQTETPEDQEAPGKTILCISG